MNEIEVYTITYDINRWWYTSSDEDVYVAPVTFRTLPISRSNVELSTDDTSASFKVEFPLDAEFLEMFRVSPPSGLVTLLCEKYDSVTGLTSEIIFKGRIINVGWEISSAVVTCESSSQAIKRMGLRRHYQYGCPHMLYSGECRVDREDYVTVDNATNITGSSVDLLSIASLPDNYFAGGYIEYTHSTLQTVERIAISASQGSTLTLFSFPVGLGSGKEVRAYAGCDRTISTCSQRFNNAENYGGTPFIPTKNPFSGNPMF